MWLPLDNDPLSPFPLIDFKDADFPSLPNAFAGAYLAGGAALDETVQIDFSAQVGLYATVTVDTKTKSGQARVSGGLYGQQVVGVGPQAYTLLVGTGYRTFAKWTDVQFSADVSNVAGATLAAEADVANTSYAIEVFGLDSLLPLTFLPRPGLVSEDQLNAVAARLDGLYRSLYRRDHPGTTEVAGKPGDPDPTTLTAAVAPTALAIDVDGNYFKVAIRKALEVVFAAHQILKGADEAAALTHLGNTVAGQGAAELQLTAEGVTRVYREWKAAADPSGAYAIAKAWLSVSVAHDHVESNVIGMHPAAVPSFPPAPRTVRRILVRSQLVDAATSANFAYASVADATDKTTAKSLVYDLQIEHVETASRDVSYSGLEVHAKILDSKATVQGSFAQVKASAKLGVAKASFGVNWDGLSPALGVNLLAVNDVPAAQFDGKLDLVDGDINQVAVASVATFAPQTRPLGWAREFDLRSFPSARVIYIVLNRLAHLTDDATGGSIVAGSYSWALADLNRLELPDSNARFICDSLGATGLNDGPSDRKEIARWLEMVAPWND